MSVNITVNGKYVKNCQRHELLTDTDRVKKEIENERRKMRIQQVRDVSKNIAKKVRTNVELEKENQLKKIEEIKAQEMEMSRLNFLSQKEKDFRSSIFEVGTAHRAAREENSKQAENKRRDVKARKSYKPPNKIPSRSIGADKENILRNANVQTDISGKCYPKPSGDSEWKNISVFANKPKSKSIVITSEWGENNSSVSSSYSSQSSSSSLSESENSMKNEKNNQKKSSTTLHPKSTVPVLLPVESEESDSSLINKSKIEQSKESNKKLSSQPNETPKPLKSSAVNKTTTEEILTAPSTSTAARLRFTQISDIIRQQKLSDKTENSSAAKWETVETLRLQKLASKSKSPSRGLQKSLKEHTLKSLSNSRPVSTQTVSKMSSSQSTNTRVQFYDYNNKFHKQYDQPVSAVEAHELTSRSETEMNAMEMAALEVKSRESREAEMNKLRQKATERCQKAMESEQVRRAYEELTAKLDAISKQQQVLPSPNQQFASHRLHQINKEKETKLNNAVEDILRRPAVITCPLIDRPKSEIIHAATRQPGNQINGLNVESAFKQSGSYSLNSSDSCCSILLGYVDDQSKQIAYDIQTFKNQNGETDNVKSERLQNLLNRINKLRENLIKELKKCSLTETSDKGHVQMMIDSITDFKKEHENILNDDGTKDSIEVRENNVKKKEAILEKKLRDFYEIHKATQRMKLLKTAQEQTVELRNKSEEPNGQKESKNPIKTKKSSKKIMEQNMQSDQANLQYQGDSNEYALQEEKQSLKSSDFKRRENTVSEQEKSSSSEEDSEDEFIDQRKLLIRQKPINIVIKVKSDTRTKKTNRLPSKSPRKLSTLIQSPSLKKSRRKFTTIRSIDSNSTSYRSLPNKIQNNVDTILKSVPNTNTWKRKDLSQTQSKVTSEEESEKLKKKKSNLNPLMAHYVQRLLGMSRTSINALGVTSSDIETPSNSIINTTANLSAAETERLASSRLENVQKFIVDNYSFIGELEDSLRNSNSTDSSMKTLEVAWKRALKEENSKKKYADVKKVIKPSLKKTSKNQKTQLKEYKQPISLVDKATQMTDNCTQRIAKLTEMINTVRKEKQKILETTLSSASENGRNSTEYLELPELHKNNDESSTKILDSQFLKYKDVLPIKSPESASRLVKGKLTGMSRDSGISLSRPITVQESRESPIDDMHQVQSSTESLSGKCKMPPVSIARYSPQLPEDIPHQLSTILEIDTPATSRLNTSVHFQDSAVQVDDHQTDQITYRKFPSFEKYARINNLDITQFDPEFSMQFEKEFNEFINLAKECNCVDYEQFTSFSKYIAKSSSAENKEAADEILASLKLANLSFKKFFTRKEYLDEIGVSNSDLLDSQSLENLDKSKNLNSISSSISSLINIDNELKLRDILIKPFQQHPVQNDNKESISIASSSIILQSKQQTDISGLRQFTSSAKSADEKSTNLEEELKNIGITWPSTMKKKTLETQALSSSTSSNVEQSVFTPRRKHNTVGHISENSFHKRLQTPNNTTSTEDGGQQLNLREFLKKELLKRTATSSSLSFSDDSVASSILRSILSSITPSGQQQQPKEQGVPTLDRHKTSTPMASQSISSVKVGSKSQEGTSSLQLFSEESRLSSVHFVNSSTDNNTAVKNG